MISTAATFIATIMSFYGYCHLILQREQYFENTTWINSGWLMLYISGTFMVIYYCSSLANEVNIHWIDKMIQIVSILIYNASTFLFCSQGKQTFRIVYDIINCCNDPDVIHMVRN